MKKNSFKIYLVPVIYSVVVIVIFGSMMYMSTNLNLSEEVNSDVEDYVIDIIDSEYIPVVSEVENSLTSPIISDEVVISVEYYSKDDEAEVQENSLIYYNNKYMQNTGILYGSSNEFDVVSIYDGTVTDIYEDELLGNVVEIEHNSSYTSIYYGLTNVELNIGDVVLTGQLLGQSSNLSLDENYENNILIEVYYEGKLTDPADCYNIVMEN